MFWKDLAKKNKPIFAVAPMAGVTDLGFRLLCKKYGADVMYTEMVSIDGLYYDSENTENLLVSDKKDTPTVLQLFGKRPELIAKAVQKVEAAGFDGIDINFGCPAKKVVAHEGGVTLLRDLNLVKELVHATCEASSLPVSVKTRTSIKTKDGKDKITVFDFIDKIKDLPVAALMLHGRSFEQGFSGEVDYEILKEAKTCFNGVFLANGGLNTPQDVKTILDKTGADGVGLARGLYGSPWLFEQSKKFLKTGKVEPLTLAQIKKVALQHAKINYKTKGDHGIVEMRKHLCWYFRGFPNASDWRQKLVRVESVKELKRIFKEMS